MSQNMLGFLRGLAMVLIPVVLTYLGNVANLSGILNPTTATIIAGLALWLDHAMVGSSGSSIFGRVA